MVEKKSFDSSKAIGHKFTPASFTLTNNEAILYALSIGFQKDPLNKAHFKFSYENAEDFSVFPT